MTDERAAFGLQFGHGLGVGLYESPMISRLHSFDSPGRARGRHGLRARDVLPRDRRPLGRADRGRGRGHAHRPARAHALPGRGAARHRHDLRARRRPARRARRVRDDARDGVGRDARRGEGGLGGRPLPADAADPRLRGARPDALPPRRGLRDDASLLGPGGGRGRLRERAARRRPRRVHLPRPRAHARARAPTRRRCSPRCSAARPGSTAAVRAR